MLDPNTITLIIKSTGSASTVLGSILLAVRVKNFISALSLAAECHELAIQSMLSNGPIYNAHGSNQHISRAKRSGNWLIVGGFGLIALGGVLNIIAIWL
jgi:hypothetical protein